MWGQTHTRSKRKLNQDFINRNIKEINPDINQQTSRKITNKKEEVFKSSHKSRS